MPPSSTSTTTAMDMRRPGVLVMAGAACTAASGAFVKLSGTEAGTAAFLRCALALLVLAPFAVREYRRVGARDGRLLLLDAAAGALLGIDFVLWSACVLNLGASIAAVLLNVQVIVFPLLARMVSGTRLPGRFVLAIPVMLAGVALAGGAVGGTGAGGDPVTGVLQGTASGVAYAGYLFLTRLAGGRRHSVQPVCVSTAAAAAAAAVLGGVWTGISLPDTPAAWGWLAALALIGQVLAWLLIGAALPRLAPNVGAALLLMQPVLAVLVGVVALAERPTLWQIAGSVLVVATVWYATRAPRGDRPSGSAGGSADGRPVRAAPALVTATAPVTARSEPHEAGLPPQR
ncbi:DMT family transporter [Streptomyces sp. N2-109]|uniref:DMT family transporter n=1 Tax=Streptomyces gossypii TaxID=2883101 RepID=A0ABT2K087_9ACTN|nr:DMT family transporter [Streptomyces gossypii]MCT2593582.1 DMT family transporter [Streptomyces gossypii]